MTLEEAMALLQTGNTESLEEIITAINTEHKSVVAERDSLAEENAAVKAKTTKLESELQETKKLNFTLARQFNSPAEPIEKTMFEALGKR